MASEKTFCINWYPNDYLSGTMYFDLEEKGGYVELLMLQCNTGKFTIEQAQRVLGAAFPKVWKVAAKKFKCENDLYWNVRMAKEIDKRVKYSESRSGNRSVVSPSYEQHMEKENETVNKNKFIKPVLEEVKSYFLEIGLNGMAVSEAGKFINYYESKGWLVGKTPMKNWKAACRNWKGNLKSFNNQENVRTEKIGRLDKNDIAKFINGD